jgi:hypothetical protein
MPKQNPSATYDDVNLILRLYELRREERMRTARGWFRASFHPKNFEEAGKLCPPGSEENASMRMVLSYWDMVTSFITSGVLNEELFFQNNREFLLTWTRLEPILAGLRSQYKEPTAYKNIETVASAFIEWMNKQAPGSYEAFASRVNRR